MIEARLKTATLTVDANGAVRELKQGADFIPLSLTRSGRAEGANSLRAPD